MKIYFEDGELREPSGIPGVVTYVDAKNGYSKNIGQLQLLHEIGCNHFVYTNSIIAISNKLCWNDDLGVPELYFRDSDTGEFLRVDKFTDKEIHKNHNLMQMYLNNAFGNVPF